MQTQFKNKNNNFFLMNIKRDFLKINIFKIKNNIKLFLILKK